MTRAAAKPKFAELYKDHPFQQFARACEENNAVPLNIFEKLQDDALCLDNYVISHGVALAFGQALIRFDGTVQSVLLGNNALADESLAALLRGLVVRQDVRKLVIVNNEVGPRSVE